MRNKGVIQVSFDALRGALELPDNTRIMAVAADSHSIGKEQFFVYLEGPWLPEWKEGEEVQLVTEIE